MLAGRFLALLAAALLVASVPLAALSAAEDEGGEDAKKTREREREDAKQAREREREESKQRTERASESSATSSREASVSDKESAKSSKKDDGGSDPGGKSGGGSSDGGSSGGGSSGSGSSGGSSDGGSSGSSSGGSDSGSGSSSGSGGSSSSDSSSDPSSGSSSGGSDASGGSTSDSDSGSSGGSTDSGSDSTSDAGSASGDGSADAGSGGEGSTDAGAPEATTSESAATSSGERLQASSTGGGSGGSTPREPPVLATHVGDGRYVSDVNATDTPVARVEFELRGDGAPPEVLYVKARALDGAPPGFPEATGALAYFDLHVRDTSGAVVPVAEARVAFRVEGLPEDAFPILLHGVDGKWQALDTERDGDLYVADAAHFSPFALAPDRASASLATAFPRDVTVRSDALEYVGLRLDLDWPLRDVKIFIDGIPQDAWSQGDYFFRPADTAGGVHEVVVSARDAGVVREIASWSYTVDAEEPRATLEALGPDVGAVPVRATWSDDVGVANVSLYVNERKVQDLDPALGTADVRVPLKDAANARLVVTDVLGKTSDSWAYLAPLEPSEVLSSSSTQGKAGDAKLYLGAGGLLVALGGTAAVVGQRAAKKAARPKVLHADVSEADRCDLCLGNFKSGYESHRCACGVTLHGSCYLRAGACPGCGSTEGLEVGES